ncbi:helix-turn-helix domain-containing protein [Culicoidibacter larvae]|uniref:Helix-turn-helix domain-containing protein n=1 Tax=Culicoidibacter larvae TaxID=2579976 RepID=A0A5R8QAA4_9FIRM|nr:XRE family transcriptional regulator [Culicoidibacter larvae]TLG72521.1 helix-turn-helix domain-containing protein [Culicoidibacter larvae]
MLIGKKLKSLRVEKGLTQEELGERTDLTKGFISQLERDLNSPSIETLLSILEVLGCPPKDFFDEGASHQKILYTNDECTVFEDDEKGYRLQWLVPESNENEMEPVKLTFTKKGEFKKFEPSLSETFGYVLKGSVQVNLGEQEVVAKSGESIYFYSESEHQLSNAHNGESEVILVVTNSYL